jgi:CBS domain-containing protein
MSQAGLEIADVEAHHRSMRIGLKKPGTEDRPPNSPEEAMTVKAILQSKGHDVLTIGPDETLADAIRLLAERRIGALVITNAQRQIAGILSERDIVRVIASEGAGALSQAVRNAMTAKVRS